MSTNTTTKELSQAEQDDLAAYEALSAREKAARGLAYQDFKDPSLTLDRLKARTLCTAYNTHPWPSPSHEFGYADFYGPDSRQQHLADLFRVSLEKAKRIAVEPPFYCDYGYNIEFKGDFYCNFGCVFLDGAKITFGERAVVAPGVHIYCATHSVDVDERRGWYDRAYEVTIGDDVWIGGGVKILAPTTIGDGVTIAAGAVVKGHFPSNVVIGGVPARILKYLPPPPPMKPGAKLGEEGSGAIDAKDVRLRRKLPGHLGQGVKEQTMVEKMV